MVHPSSSSSDYESRKPWEIARDLAFGAARAGVGDSSVWVRETQGKSDMSIILALSKIDFMSYSKSDNDFLQLNLVQLQRILKENIKEIKKIDNKKVDPQRILDYVNRVLNPKKEKEPEAVVPAKGIQRADEEEEKQVAEKDINHKAAIKQIDSAIEDLKQYQKDPNSPLNQEIFDKAFRKDLQNVFVYLQYLLKKQKSDQIKEAHSILAEALAELSNIGGYSTGDSVSLVVTETLKKLEKVKGLLSKTSAVKAYEPYAIRQAMITIFRHDIDSLRKVEEEGGLVSPIVFNAKSNLKNIKRHLEKLLEYNEANKKNLAMYKKNKEYLESALRKCVRGIDALDKDNLKSAIDELINAKMQLYGTSFDKIERAEGEPDDHYSHRTELYLALEKTINFAQDDSDVEPPKLMDAVNEFMKYVKGNKLLTDEAFSKLSLDLLTLLTPIYDRQIKRNQYTTEEWRTSLNKQVESLKNAQTRVLQVLFEPR